LPHRISRRQKRLAPGRTTPDPPPWCHHQIRCPRTPGRNFRGHRRMTARRWSAHSRVSARADEGPRGRRRGRRSRLRPLHSGARSVSAGGKANGLRVCAGAKQASVLFSRRTRATVQSRSTVNVDSDRNQPMRVH
jgi:hypothetical protein